MFRTRRIAAVAVAALALVAAGCGDDGDSASADEQPYVDALATSLKDDPDATFEDDESECLAELLVTTVGVDRFEEAGVEPADLESDDFDPETAGLEFTSEDEQALTDGVADCIDVVDFFVESVASQSDLGDEELDCIRENVDEDLMKRMMGASIAGNEDDDPELEAEFESMFTDLADACPAIMGG